MKARTISPRNMDIGVFIESGEPLTGSHAPAELERLASGLAQDLDLAELPALTWAAQGRAEAQRVGRPHLWLDLRAEATLAWTCQRCLHPVTEHIEVERSIRFVEDEAAAAELDADSDDDVLALSRHFNLVELVEDELIMAQPIVPRHDVCPTDVTALMRDDTLVGEGAEALPAAADGDAPAAVDEVPLTASGRPNPFAVLAALKKGKG
jgi:uncharacterized protein